LPYSLALRSVRAHTRREDAAKDLKIVEHRFLNRGYPKQLVNDATRRALAQHQEIRDEQQPPARQQKTNLITTYHPQLSGLSQILKRHYHILEADPRLKSFFPTPPGITYRRTANLRDRLVHARVNRQQSSRFPTCAEGCGVTRCLVCSQLATNDSVVSSIDNSYTFTIRESLNCNSKNLVYLLQCNLCRLQYIGETQTSFRLRFNNHKSHINSMPLLPISQHVCKTGHSFRNFAVYLLKSGFSSSKDRLAFESYMIHNFKTRTLGLNKDPGVLGRYL
jgi:hypothetical protein